MQRARLGGLVVVALIGVLALTGCKNDPSVAVQIGDYTLTNEQVDAMAADFDQSRTAPSGDPAELAKISTGDVRQYIATATAFNEVGRRYAREKGISIPTPDYEAVATGLASTPDNAVVRLVADYDTIKSALLENSAPQTPTEDDLRHSYDLYRKFAGDQASAFDQVKPALLAEAGYQEGIHLRNELTAAAQRYGLTIGPRYQPVVIELFSVGTQAGGLTLVDMPLGDQGTGAVRSVG